MSLTLHAEPAALRVDDRGDVRVGNTRVLLDLVVRAFEDGATPETIAQRYPALHLEEVYSAIAYYLRHRSEVNAYMQARESRAEALRKTIESRQANMAEIRRRLLTRRHARDGNDAEAVGR